MSGKAMNQQTVTLDRQALKFGGVLAVMGGLGYFVTLLLHGDLPDQTVEITLDHIAGRPEWRVLKLALIVSVLCWIGALTALIQSLPQGLSRHRTISSQVAYE
jgi:hypothetical protein